MAAIQQTYLKPSLKMLKKFGLNPNDWAITNPILPSNSIHLIINKKDPEFCLKAHVNGRNLKRLEVVSL